MYFWGVEQRRNNWLRFWSLIDKENGMTKRFQLWETNNEAVPDAFTA